MTFHVSWRPVLYTYIITINFLIIVNPINNTTQLFTGLFTIQICFQLRKDVFFGVFLWFAWKGFWDRIFFVLVWDIIFYYQESDKFLCDFVFPASCVFCVKCEGIIINNSCWYISLCRCGIKGSAILKVNVSVHVYTQYYIILHYMTLYRLLVNTVRVSIYNTTMLSSLWSS